MTAVIFPALLLIVAIAFGCLLDEAHAKRRAAEHAQRLAEEDAEALGNVVAANAETIAANEGTIAHQRQRLADTEALLTAERARNEIHQSAFVCLPTLPGIATHGVTEPIGEVVDDEPTWVGLVREVADVVPLNKGRRA